MWKIYLIKFELINKKKKTRKNFHSTAIPHGLTNCGNNNEATILLLLMIESGV